MSRIENLTKVLGLLICLVFAIFPEGNSELQFTLFALILLSIGIPHGAIDHLISNPKIDRKGLLKFLLVYLSLITGYLLIWYFFPLLALGAFLVMSAYHFGQSHFISESLPKGPTWPLFLSRGGYFLFAILLGDWAGTKLILSSLIDLGFLDSDRLLILGSLFLLTVIIQSISGPKLSKIQFLECLILGPILYFSPLLIGFVIYFGFWHALPSMISEYKFLSKNSAYNTVKKFGIQLLPFSLISFIGIGLILFLGLEFLETNQLVLLFFVLISLISFPHILYMDRFLKSQNQN
jgi:Brp/Blh family beta-carotene 15,15'-monooxygenase